MYGELFINCIFEFIKRQNDTSVKGSTYTHTYDMYKEGYSVEDIAIKRELSEGTVYSHLIFLYENKYNIDVYKFVSHKEMNQVFNAIKQLGNTYKLKEIHTHLNEEIDYNKIKFALAHYLIKKYVTQ